MMLTDNEDIRNLITDLFCDPLLKINGAAKASGQRLVYFGEFLDKQTDETWCLEDCNPKEWGEVVVKVSSMQSAQSILYLQKEIQILESIDSDHYPKVLYTNSFNHNNRTEEPLSPRLFVTIEERVNAKPLSELKAMYSSESSVVELLKNLILALKILWEHSDKLVHRDLKPDNILVRRSGEIVIIDLGIARETGSDGLTSTHVDFGPNSARYTSPEQARNKKRDITYKSDLFALGIVVYELISGEHPFYYDNLDDESVRDRICEYEPVNLYDRGCSSKRLSNVVAKMMEKQPYRRYRRYQDIIADLESE